MPIKSSNVDTVCDIGMLNGPTADATITITTVAAPSTSAPPPTRFSTEPEGGPETPDEPPPAPSPPTNTNKKPPTTSSGVHQVTFCTHAGITMRPHPKRGAVTQMLPGRSPGSRVLGRSKFVSTTGPRLPVCMSTVAKCESSSRSQWRYRSGFSPLSLLISTTR